MARTRQMDEDTSLEKVIRLVTEAEQHRPESVMGNRKWVAEVLQLFFFSKHFKDRVSFQSRIQKLNVKHAVFDLNNTAYRITTIYLYL